MTAQEKAKAGLWMLREAVLEYLAGRPQGARGIEIKQALGLNLDSDPEGGRKGYIGWGLVNLLIKEGKVERRPVDGRTYIHLVANQPQATV